MNPKLSACLKLAVIPYVGMFAVCGGISSRTNGIGDVTVSIC
jgi:hypothetical protein